MAPPKRNVFEMYRDLPPVKDVRKRGPRIYGGRTHLGFSEFMWDLFRLNETERKTDATLRTIVMREFAHEQRTMASIECGNQTIAKLRHEYNRGKLQPKTFPSDHPGKVPKLSCRYNDQGQVMNPRAPSQIATNRAIWNNYLKFQDTVHETFEDLMTRLGRPVDQSQYVPGKGNNDGSGNLESVREASGSDVGNSA